MFFFFFPPQNNYIFIVVFVPFVRFKPSSFIQIQTFWPTWKSFKNERFLLNIFLAFVSFVFPLFCFRSFEKSRLGLGEGWRKEIKKLKLNKRTHRMVRLSVLKNHRRLCEKRDFHNFKNSFPSTLRASTWPVSFCSFRRVKILQQVKSVSYCPVEREMTDKACWLADHMITWCLKTRMWIWDFCFFCSNFTLNFMKLFFPQNKKNWGE